MIGRELQHCAKVLEIEQQQAVVVGELEHQREHALLRGIQVEQAAEEQRTEIGDGRAHRIAAAPEDVPEDDRRRGPVRLGETDGLQPIAHLRRGGSGCRHARQVALDIGEKDGYADQGEAFGEHLQRDGLAGAGCAGDEPVPVGEHRPKRDVAAGGRSPEHKRFTHRRLSAFGFRLSALSRGPRIDLSRFPRLWAMPLSSARPKPRAESREPDIAQLGGAAAPRCCISSRANSGPFPSSSCLKYTNTSRHEPVSRAMTSPHCLMSAGL